MWGRYIVYKTYLNHYYYFPMALGLMLVHVGMVSTFRETLVDSCPVNSSRWPSESSKSGLGINGIA